MMSTDVVFEPISVVLEPTGHKCCFRATDMLLEPTTTVLNLRNAVMKSTSAVLEPTGAVLEPRSVVLFFWTSHALFRIPQTLFWSQQHALRRRAKAFG